MKLTSFATTAYISFALAAASVSAAEQLFNVRQKRSGSGSGSRSGHRDGELSCANTVEPLEPMEITLFATEEVAHLSSGSITLLDTNDDEVVTADDDPFGSLAISLPNKCSNAFVDFDDTAARIISGALTLEIEEDTFDVLLNGEVPSDSFITGLFTTDLDLFLNKDYFCLAEALRAFVGFLNDVEEGVHGRRLQRHLQKRDCSWWRSFRLVSYIVLACGVGTPGTVLGCIGAVAAGGPALVGACMGIAAGAGACFASIEAYDCK